MAYGWLSFSLEDRFVAPYAEREVDWGFPVGEGLSLGEITYIDKYSRRKPDRTKERWHETVRRVVEGCFSIRKDWMLSMRLPYRADRERLLAERMYELIFSFRFLPPGRGLWMMGTEYLHTRRDSAALNNCAFISTGRIDEDPVYPFAFLMDLSMLGVGVGFDTRGAGKVIVREPRGPSRRVAVTDSREGWVRSTALLLGSYLKGKSPYEFDYSRVRPKGAKIEGFGGVASGPEPLIELHETLRRILGRNAGKPISSRLIVDICNLIGRCVVSGNVRRSAEIALGSADDEDFFYLKDYEREENAERCAPGTGWAYTSNNSVIVCENDEVDWSRLIRSVARTSEPGVFFLDNARIYGRTCDEPDYRDLEALGTNPCGEQTLHDGELCNLVEVFPTKHESLAEFRETLYYALLYGKSVTLMPTHLPRSNAVMQRNRRIGCSLSGIVQFVADRGERELIRWMDEGYRAMRDYDREISRSLCVQESVKLTSIKPSGTVSILVGVTPGVHYPVETRYIRRMRFDNGNPILDILREAGVPVHPAPESPERTSVVELPVLLDGEVPSQREATVDDKLHLAELCQRYWADNQVSVTVTFDPESESERLALLMEAYSVALKGLSFQPTPKLEDVSALEAMKAPYQPISAEDYERISSGIKEVDLSLMYSGGEDAKGSRYCESDRCEIL